MTLPMWLWPVAVFATTIFQIPGYKLAADFKAAIQPALSRGLVTSVCRTPSHNKRVGGARSSLHTKCKAVDLSIRTPQSVISAIRNKGFCPKVHGGNTVGGGSPHYHVVACSTKESRRQARSNRESSSNYYRQANSDGRTNWRRNYRGESRRKVRPPTYQPWDSKKFWEEMGYR